MGFTRSWDNRFGGLTEFPQEFLDGVDALIDASNKAGVTIRNGFGEGEPIVTPTKILLNGDASKQEDYETLAFVIGEMGNGFNFCKTARMPYDGFVEAVLRLARHQGLISYSSNPDGDNDNNCLELLKAAGLWENRGWAEKAYIA